LNIFNLQNPIEKCDLVHKRQKQFHVCAFQLMQTEGSYFSRQVVAAFECYMRVSNSDPACSLGACGFWREGAWHLVSDVFDFQTGFPAL